MDFKISDTSLVMRTMNQVCCDMTGEAIILSLKSGMYYSLDEVGAKIWALIEKPISLAGICDSIGNEYDVQAEVCERDVQKFIEGLEAAGLIQVHNETAL